jgi:hypothetical protein
LLETHWLETHLLAIKFLKKMTKNMLFLFDFAVFWEQTNMPFQDPR